MADISVRASRRTTEQHDLASEPRFQRHPDNRNALTQAGLLCILLLVGLLPATAAATPPRGMAAASDGHTIRTSNGYVARIGAFRIRRDPTIGAAARAFGQPSSRRLTSGACRVEWRHLRLRIDFANYGYSPGQTTCSDSVGLAQSFVTRGRQFRTWEGLRVGQRSETILDRHSSAEFRRNSWWLRTATSPFGDESEYAVVRAITANGRVVALGGWIGAAGE